jgi:hypothetical protein
VLQQPRHTCVVADDSRLAVQRGLGPLTLELEQAAGRLQAQDVAVIVRVDDRGVVLGGDEDFTAALNKLCTSRSPAAWCP